MPRWLCVRSKPLVRGALVIIAPSLHVAPRGALLAAGFTPPRRVQLPRSHHSRTAVAAAMELLQVKLPRKRKAAAMLDDSTAAASSPLARESVRDTRAPASNAAAFRVSIESEAKAALATDAATTTPLSSKAARALLRDIFSRAIRASTSTGGAGDAQLSSALSDRRSYDKRNAFRVLSLIHI